jgi:N-methylhydantoinase B
LTPGGGGYGEPLAREPEAVLADVTRGLVGVEAAERDYGVVVRDGGVDADATARIRGSSEAREDGRLFDFGPEREAWESACDDATVTRLACKLYRVPLSVRSETRRQLFEAVFPKLTRGDTSIAEAIGDAEASGARFRAAVEALPDPGGGMEGS